MTRVFLNRRGIESLKTDAGVQAELEKIAQKVADRASATAPVLSGTYAAAFSVEDGEDGAKRVVNDATDGGHDYSMYVEADTGTLARALDAA